MRFEQCSVFVIRDIDISRKVTPRFGECNI